MEDFQLSPSDKASNLWGRLKTHLVDRLALARVRLEQPTHSETETASLRGEIRMLKALIALGEDRSIPTE